MSAPTGPSITAVLLSKRDGFILVTRIFDDLVISMEMWEISLSRVVLVSITPATLHGRCGDRVAHPTHQKA